MDEVWKPLCGYEGIYEISNKGNFMSLTRYVDKGDVIQKRVGRVKKQWLNQDGYPSVKLSRDGESKNVCVHLLVAKTFLGDMSDEYEVNHIDYDRTNNDVSNLEWVSHKDNVSHSSSVGRYRRSYGEDNPNYGNHKLHDRYMTEPGLSSIQSRPGAQNGRVRPIMMTCPDGEAIRFDYIGECAQWLIDNGYTKSRKECVASAISERIRWHKPYKHFLFEPI